MYSKDKCSKSKKHGSSGRSGRFIFVCFYILFYIFDLFKYRRGRPVGSGSGLSPSGDKLIKTMKRYLKAAGIKRVKFSKLWEGYYFFYILLKFEIDFLNKCC